MDTVELESYIYRGTHRGSVGLYTLQEGGAYCGYAGGRNEGGVAHGEGVVTWYNGTTFSGQLADGHWHGHREVHYTNGDVVYELYERGNKVHSAHVRPDGDCLYDGKPCGADHADFAKLQAASQQAGVRMPPTRIQRTPAP